MENESSAPVVQEPAWKPLTAKQRRVLGTLMEKSKTTPDAYPMTFAGLTTGCNQKSNRAPITEYSTEQVESIVDELRALGAVAIVQGSGRVTKVRHYAYNCIGLSKVEAAVMTELLLRGEQTLGELRTRASRMEPIQDLDELKRIVDGLISRNLILELTPAGRGQILSHNLYPERELEGVRKSVASGISAAGLGVGDESGAGSGSVASAGSSRGQSADLRSEIDDLRTLVHGLKDRVLRLEKEIGIES